MVVKMIMKIFSCEAKYVICHLLLVILPIIFIDTCHARPHEDCYDHMNTSDCGFPPSPVFYYYHSGSRCEIAMWRGCPTYNMFPDERVCSHFCIGRVIGIMRENEVDTSPPAQSKDTAHEIEEWKESLNGLDNKDTDFMSELLDRMDEDSQPVEKLKFSVPNDEIVEGTDETAKDQEATTANAANQGTAAPNAPKTTEAKPDETKSDEAKPDDAKPDDAKAEEAKPDEAKPDETEPGATETTAAAVAAETTTAAVAAETTTAAVAAETTTAAAAAETTTAAAAAETTAAPTTTVATTLDPDLGDPDEVISTL